MNDDSNVCHDLGLPIDMLHPLLVRSRVQPVVGSMQVAFPSVYSAPLCHYERHELISSSNAALNNEYPTSWIFH